MVFGIKLQLVCLLGILPDYFIIKRHSLDYVIYRTLSTSHDGFLNGIKALVSNEDC